MHLKNKKEKRLKKLKPKRYRIYGIFDFISKTLIQVDLDLEKLTFEYELTGYDPNKYDIVSFDIIVN